MAVITSPAIDGLSSWMYAVNGAGYPNIDVGAFNLSAPQQRPRESSTRARPSRPTHSCWSCTSSPVRPSETGQERTTVTVRGDALSAPNSAADAKRFGVAASKVVAPKDFPLVTGATIHVGNNTYVDGVDGDALDGAVTVTEPWYEESHGHLGREGHRRRPHVRALEPRDVPSRRAATGAPARGAAQPVHARRG